MIKVSINNKIEVFEANINVIQALDKLGYANAKMLGVAVNHVFISKDDWTKTTLNDSDKVDILNPVSGG